MEPTQSGLDDAWLCAFMAQHTDAQRAQAVAEKVRQHVERTPVPLSGEKSLTVSISLGLAAFDDHPDDQHLINRADQALYTAKAQGRNRCAVAA
ncbi:MAG: hypothetical protein Fur007_20860 [Rhodoferax sp.]